MGPRTYREYQTVLELKADELTRKKPGKISKRSFLGCLNCKRRRIKCDETKRQCRNCAKSGLECKWPFKSPNNALEVALEPSSAHLYAQEPNVPPLTHVRGSSVSILPSKPTKVPVCIRQELSSTREDYAKAPVSPTSTVSLEESAPRTLFMNTGSMEESLDSFRENHNLTMVRKAPEFSKASGIFESLGHVLIQAPNWVDNSRANDSEKTKVTESTLKTTKSSDPKKSPPPQQTEVLVQSLENRSDTDMYFLSSFIHSFLPTIAQVNFQDQAKFSELVLAAANESKLLQEVFIACGASIIAFNNSKQRDMAHERYTKAINHYLNELKLGAVKGGEVWFFVAVQVLQTLCLRDMFADSNATRCAAHFGAAYKIISWRLSRKDNDTSTQKPISDLEKIMIENFLFNYSITIFFCDHHQLPQLVPTPFDFFHPARARLVEIFYDSTDRYKYRSMLAFQIAAKCSWSCRLKLPLDSDGKLLHMELIQLAEALLLSFENEAEQYCSSNVKITTSIAKVVLKTSLILLHKMIDFETTTAASLQGLVKGIRGDIDQPHNRATIFPIWSLMIAASTSVELSDRRFFKNCLENLLIRSKSRIIVQVLNHLDGLWELYYGEEPFELMFDTTVLDQVCN